MDAAALILTTTGVLAAGLVVLFLRRLVSPRQFALALGGLACGAAIGAVWAGGPHG